jgi:hypothetical protein
MVAPTELDFGVVDAGDTVLRTVTVTNGGSCTLEVAAFLNPRCSDGVFTIVDGNEQRVLPAGASFDVVVRFQSEEPGAGYTCDITLGNEACPSVGLRAATIALPCEQTPRSYDFGTVLIGETYVQNFTITNRTELLLNAQIQADCQTEVGYVPEEDSEVTLRPGQRHSFRFILDPTLGAGSCEIWAGADICERIPVSWNGEFPNTQCELSTSQVTVEEEVGQWTTTGFEIVNQGNTPLFLDVQFREPEGCAPFELVQGGGESRLDPGGYLVVKMLYAPTTPGATLCHVLPIVNGQLPCGFVSVLGTATE